MPSGIKLDPSLLTVAWDGVNHKVRPKTFQVLEYLLANRDRTVSKQELFDAVWNDCAVTDDVLVKSVAELRRILETDRGTPKILITVPRVGYRLIAQPSEIAAPPESPRPAPRRRVWYLTAGLALSVIVLAAWFRLDPSRSSLDAARPVVVLPLDNVSSTAAIDWLRDGLADMLITSLSQVSGLSVLSLQEVHRQLSRQGSRDEFKLARGLRASALVKGSFASLGGQLRVDVQLIDGNTGRVMGGESLTVASPDQLLSSFDALTVRLAGRLGLKHGGNLVEVMTSSLEAYRLYTLGLEKAASYRNREAIELFQRAAALDPDFAMAHARTGYAYAVTWNLAAEARPHLERALRLSKGLTPKDRLFVTGWNEIARLEFPRAVEIFRDLTARYPGETEAFIRLGNLLRGEERLEEALEVARRGLTADPGEPELYELLAGVLAQLGRHQESVEAAKRLVQYAPDASTAHDMLGEVQQWAGRPEEAMASYRRAQELAPGFERPVVHLGNLYFQLGRYREAIRQYERYIEMAPSPLERGRGWGRIAWVWWRKGDVDRASAAAATELKLVPTSVWNSIVLALARSRHDTVAALSKRMDEFPYSSRGARTGQRYRDYFEGYIALKQGRTKEALERLSAAVRRPAPYWSMEAYQDCLGDALLELGRFPEAAAEYRRVLAVNPGNALARFHLAQALERAGQADAARQEYRLFAAQWKDADRDLPEVLLAAARTR